jgi:hypothetical protein
VPPEYIGQEVWVRWDSREVRIFNQRWEQIHLHAQLQPGQFDKVLGLSGGTGPLERQLAYWLQRAHELGTPHDARQCSTTGGLAQNFTIRFYGGMIQFSACG